MDEWNAKTNHGRNFKAGEEEFATAVKVITRIKKMNKRDGERKSFWGGGGAVAKEAGKIKVSNSR